jgi:hypothetical protein
MRPLLTLCCGGVLMVGCASPAPPPKPSPYRYARVAQVKPIQVPQSILRRRFIQADRSGPIAYALGWPLVRTSTRNR